jgi:hypothetical protein
VRGIVEYNGYRYELVTDSPASFTFIPVTVVHPGYGSLYERTRWESDRYVPADELIEVRRPFFFKASYLFRR